MTDSLSFTLLPAYEGDAIDIRWGDRRMLVDLGRKGTGRRIAASLAAEGVSEIELVVITHIDVDHIGGALSALVDPESPIADVTVHDVWFNGHRQLPRESVAVAGTRTEEYGVKDGIALERWLAGDRPWNEAFDGGAVQRLPDQPATQVSLPDGLDLWIIGPTPARLAALRPVWDKHIAAEEAALDQQDQPDSDRIEAYGDGALLLDDRYDLELLAGTPDSQDTVSNGTSIALILGWRGRRLLLAGDAHADDLIDGIAAVDPTNTHFDIVKLPHHASKNNVTQQLTDSITADCWAVSTSGSRHRHPDAAAIARILLSNLRRADASGRSEPATQRLAFNLRSDHSGVWDDDRLRDRFSFCTDYGSDDDGLTVLLDANEDR